MGGALQWQSFDQEQSNRVIKDPRADYRRLLQEKEALLRVQMTERLEKETDQAFEKGKQQSDAQWTQKLEDEKQTLLQDFSQQLETLQKESEQQMQIIRQEVGDMLIHILDAVLPICLQENISKQVKQIIDSVLAQKYHRPLIVTASEANQELLKQICPPGEDIIYQLPQPDATQIIALNWQEGGSEIDVNALSINIKQILTETILPKWQKQDIGEQGNE